MHEKNAAFWIERLGMNAHPEGGYFRETYRSEEKVAADALPAGYSNARTLSTSIYFLLTLESSSHFHKLRSDEVWHYHTGGAAAIHIISPEGLLTSKRIGPAFDREERFQVIVPKGHWFAAEVDRGEFVLAGCTVAPGFEPDDFELADRDTLASLYPEHSALIRRLTPEPDQL